MGKIKSGKHKRKEVLCHAGVVLQLVSLHQDLCPMRVIKKTEVFKEFGRINVRKHPLVEKLARKLLVLKDDEVIFISREEWPLKATVSEWIGSRRHMKKSRLFGLDFHGNKVKGGWIIFKGKPIEGGEKRVPLRA